MQDRSLDFVDKATKKGEFLVTDMSVYRNKVCFFDASKPIVIRTGKKNAKKYIESLAITNSIPAFYTEKVTLIINGKKLHFEAKKLPSFISIKSNSDVDLKEMWAWIRTWEYVTAPVRVFGRSKGWIERNKDFLDS
jgi:hypothetical protein